MSDEQKNTKEETLNCCEGMPFAEMMQMMMNQQGEGLGFDCSEMMSQMMEKMKTGGDPMAMCKEMMQKMKKECC
jgi:phage-related minor tail protein